jgi:S-adenosyl-L-methionine hydrolase (adenosine-forming)
VFITFLTDFGLRDDFVGTCHGVIKRIAPEAHIVDITHGIEPQRVLQGALVLRSTLPYMPEGIHLAVVDPGVGGRRRAVVLTGAEGRSYVGPDNGLLVPAAERLGGIERAYELTNPVYRLDPVSYTFHGRDVFAPAAAHLAKGAAPADFGPEVDPATLVRLDLPQPELDGRRIRATVLYIDRFGNVQLNLTREQLEEAGVEPGDEIEVELAHERYFALVALTFSEARSGDIVLYEDAYGNASIAINQGSAAEMFGVRSGQELRLRVRK